MGLRFRKSFKIAPGVRLNLNRKSVGVSLGGKGARYSINSSGRRTATVSVPGTGISYSKTTAGKSSSGKSAPGTSERYRGKSVNNSAVSGDGKKKKSSWWKWAIAVIVICGLIGSCFGGNQTTTPGETASVVETEATVETVPTEESSSVVEIETAIESEPISEEEVETEIPESTESEAETVPSLSAESPEVSASDPAVSEVSPTSAAASVDSVQNETSAMVWVSETGSKYHSINNCGNMDPNKAQQITMEEAVNRGMEPCSKCW